LPRNKQEALSSQQNFPRVTSPLHYGKIETLVGRFNQRSLNFLHLPSEFQYSGSEALSTQRAMQGLGKLELVTGLAREHAQLLQCDPVPSEASSEMTAFV